MERFCGICGRKIPTGGIFCPKCGAKVRPWPPEEEKAAVRRPAEPVRDIRRGTELTAYPGERTASSPDHGISHRNGSDILIRSETSRGRKPEETPPKLIIRKPEDTEEFKKYFDTPGDL